MAARLAERARRLNRGGARHEVPGGGAFALLSDRDRLPDPGPLLDLLPAGSLVILRHTDAATRRRLGVALAPACRARRLFLLVADDLDLAVALGVGLHLPERALATVAARVRLWHRGRGRLLTAAVHSAGAMEKARRAGADALLLSPVFATLSHPEAVPMGALRFRLLVRRSPLPVLALGGVTPATLARLRQSGAAGVATVGGLQHR